jgi:hypothetical protein
LMRSARRLEPMMLSINPAHLKIENGGASRGNAGKKPPCNMQHTASVHLKGCAERLPEDCA